MKKYLINKKGKQVIAAQGGFTLIELLVVIAIIGIFATATLSVLNPFEQFKKSNDAKRKSELSQIQRALDLYYQDQGRYPDSSADYKILPNTQALDWGASWQPYMTRLPKDPTGGQNYVYFSPTTSNGQTYYLYASLERGQVDPQACNKGDACTSMVAGFPGTNACGKTCNYGVTSSNVSP